jgi:hypothetical protein
MDPEMIMTMVISLIILAIGVFAFFVVAGSFPDIIPKGGATSSTVYNSTYYGYMEVKNNTTQLGNQVFNIIGIVLVIGAIMTIVGLVYSYVRPGGY